jgi:hypothetical protein
VRYGNTLRKAKKVFMQSTAQDIADHGIILSTLETVVTKLGLLNGGDNGNHTLWIIFCSKKSVDFYKHSWIADDGTISYDAFKASTSKKDGGQTLKLEDPSQYRSSKGVAIMKLCHVLSIRCQYL